MLPTAERPNQFLTSDSKKFNLQASKLWANFKKGLANAFLLFLTRILEQNIKKLIIMNKNNLVVTGR
jgi:hypothetical protein